MKIETLKERIKKAEEKAIKMNGTLERHKSQLNKKAKVLLDKGINLSNYDKFDKTKIDHEAYWDLCDYENKLEDIKNTNKKIKDTTETLEKYKKQLKNQIAKDAETEGLIPEVLNIFLENWKQKCFDFYTKLANEYIDLKFKEYEITKEELEKLEKENYNFRTGERELVKKYTNDEINHILEQEANYLYYENVKSQINYGYFTNFKNSLFSSDLYVIERIVDYNTISNKALNKILDDDVKVKKEMFIKRIKQVIGDIADLTNLKIGSNGEINGIAKGMKANAKVETITAGGYAVQCFHFRVLVNTVK